MGKELLILKEQAYFLANIFFGIEKKRFYLLYTLLYASIEDLTLIEYKVSTPIYFH